MFLFVMMEKLDRNFGINIQFKVILKSVGALRKWLLACGFYKYSID
jgi:hypothetical protein